MPYLLIQTNKNIAAERIQALMSKASKTVSEILGKSENYVMVAVQDSMHMLFAGTDQELAYVELKSIGLPEDTSPELSQGLCTLINSELGIDSKRIYIEFSNAQRHMWGWDNRTF